jgi:citrate lyase beta subunit
VIEAYHFIKYDGDTCPEDILKRSESDATLCFDFEDSIQNWISPEKNDALKINFRNHFQQFFAKHYLQLQSCKFGVRINAEASHQQLLDIQALHSVRDFVKIHSILLPKTESCQHLHALIEELGRMKIEYVEIIPIIETKKGLNNLSGIAKLFPQKIKSIGFGHCDYNLDINSFPFFHQESIEYWRWITKMHAILETDQIKLINSAYLQLDNHPFFIKMLSYLQSICGDNFGQFTLTYKQSMQCREFDDTSDTGYINIKERLNLKPDYLIAEKIVRDFESENHDFGFTVTRKNKLIISPQEYVAAKKSFSLPKNKNIEFAFLGGCFPVQYNILFEDNFHQLLKNRVENDLNANLNINIVRYERFANCIDKLKKCAVNNKPDVLVFHIRPEPYLRILKFYYKYLNHCGELKWSVNFPLLKILSPEKYDFYLLGRRYSNADRNKQSGSSKIMISLNYLSGFIIGNHFYAIRQYLKLADQVCGYCAENNIKLILLGPALRSQTKFEKTFSSSLISATERYFLKKNVVFISGIDNTLKDQAEYFNPNGIHANEKYHAFIAQRISDKLSRMITKTD